MNRTLPCFAETTSQRYHFTDAANLESIRKHGLLSAASVFSKSIKAALNSDERSRSMDKEMGLENYVRLSFNDKNPMKYVALKEKRISRAVMLQIKLQVVSRPGVLFFDCNATRHDAVQSTSPTVVHFDVVKAENHFALAPEQVHFYQAEVLVPSPLPPHLIVFPEDQKATVLPKRTGPATRNISASNRAAETNPAGGELPKPELPRVERAELCESKSCTAARRTTVTTSSHTLDDGKASLVLQDDVLSAPGDEGRRLFAKFNAWWVSMLLYHCWLPCLCHLFSLLSCATFLPRCLFWIGYAFATSLTGAKLSSCRRHCRL